MSSSIVFIIEVIDASDTGLDLYPADPSTSLSAMDATESTLFLLLGVGDKIAGNEKWMLVPGIRSPERGTGMGSASSCTEARSKRTPRDALAGAWTDVARFILD